MRALLLLNNAALCVLMFLLFFIVFLEVALRAIANISLHFSWEVAAYLMAAVFFMGSAQAFAQRAHIAIQVPMRMGGTGQSILKWTGAIVVAAALGGILYAVALDVWRDWSFGNRSVTRLEVPLYLPKLPLLIGSAISLLIVVVAAFEREPAPDA